MPRHSRRSTAQPTIICLQAGNANTGAFDPADEICPLAHEAGAWVHVDGAFGLWAAAAPSRRHLTRGLNEADSWATDAHKWLNVSYDSGLAFVRDAGGIARRDVRERALSRAGRGPRAVVFHPRDVAACPWRGGLGGPPVARASRGSPTSSSGRATTRARFADGLRAGGYTVHNDVVLNQVLVSFGDAETTRRVIAALQADGTCWCGGRIWQGHEVMRISVSSWATTEEDVARSLATMLRIAAQVCCLR